MNMSIVTIRNNLAEALNVVAYQGERVILERRGKGVAVLVSMDDLAVLEAVEDQIDVKAARQARAEGGKPVPLDKAAKQLGIALPKTRRRSTRRR